MECMLFHTFLTTDYEINMVLAYKINMNVLYINQYGNE